MKKFLKIFFATVVLFLIVSLIGIFVFIKTFDLNKYKTQISKIVYEQTGRELKLNGHAGIKISLIPTIELNDVTFSNVSWAKEPNMIDVKNINVAFSLMPLLEKQIVIDKIHLNEPKVYLIVNEKGLNNWTFSEKAGSDEQKNESANEDNVSATDVAQGAMLASFVAKSFKIENGEVIYRDLKTKSAHDLKIKKITLNSAGMDDDVNAEIDVVYNNEEIKANIVGGSINSLLHNAKTYPLKADVKAYGVTAQADGTLSDFTSDLKYDFELKLTNPSGNFGVPSVKLSTKLTGDVKKISLNIASLNVAENEIKGTVNVNLAGKTPDVKAKLNSQLIDLNKFNKTKSAYTGFSFISNAYAATFVPATPVDLGVLNLVNADVSLDVKKILLNNFIFDNVKADIKVNKGNANINIKELGLGKGSLSGTIDANKNNEFSVNLTGKDIVLQNFVTDLSPANKDVFGILSGGKTGFTVKLNSKGKDVRTIVEGLNGQFIVVVGESKIQTGTLKYLRGDFISQILSTLKLQTNDKSMEVSCAVIRSDVVDGKALFPKGVAFKSNRVTIVSDGSVNLKNDKLDLSIRPFNGKISDTNVVQAISSLLKVSGTIEKPRLTIDNSSLIKNVVGVAAAGPAFLGSQLLMDVDEYPCYTALKGTSYEKMFPAPSGAKAAGQSVYQGANDAINGGVNLVNDAAKGVINLLKGKK